MKRAATVLALLTLCGPARAFDCAKATTKFEKAICADPVAHLADDAMAAAFTAALADMSPSDKAAAQAAQLSWIGDRDRACDAASGAKLGRCLAERAAERRAFLAAEPEAGPGAPGRLAPVFRIREAAKGKARLDLQWLRYPAPATPAERAFNAALERHFGALDEPGEDETAIYEHARSMRLVYASPRLISAQVSGYDSVGGAHPSSFTAGINILVEEGREATFADLLDAKAAPRVFALCLKAVIAQKRQKQADPPDAEALKQLAKDVAESTGRLDAWSFGEAAATVTYDPYAVGAYAEGGFDCKLPYATLRPLAKPGFPLP